MNIEESLRARRRNVYAARSHWLHPDTYIIEPSVRDWPLQEWELEDPSDARDTLEDRAEAVFAKKRIQRALPRLTERERFVIMARFGIDHPEMSLEEVGKQIRVTRERVRQIEAKAMREIGAFLGKKPRALEFMPSTRKPPRAPVPSRPREVVQHRQPVEIWAGETPESYWEYHAGLEEQRRQKKINDSLWENITDVNGEAVCSGDRIKVVGPSKWHGLELWALEVFANENGLDGAWAVIERDQDGHPKHAVRTRAVEVIKRWYEVAA